MSYARESIRLPFPIDQNRALTRALEIFRTILPPMYRVLVATSTVTRSGGTARVILTRCRLGERKSTVRKAKPTTWKWHDKRTGRFFALSVEGHDDLTLGIFRMN
jgi:hypothetical protein